MNESAGREFTNELLEIPWETSEAIASWWRALGASRRDKRGIFRRASAELLQLAVAKDTPVVRQAIVDSLHHMAVVAGIDPDVAQAVMSAACDTTHHESRDGGEIEADAYFAATEPPQRVDLNPKDIPLTGEAWVTRDLPPVDRLMGEWLSTTSRVLLTGPTGLGKTNLGMAIAGHQADGRDFLHWRCHRPGRVLYVDGEMSRSLFKRRIEDLFRRLGRVPEGLFLLNHEDVDGFQPLNTALGADILNRIIEHIGGVDLVIFDNIMALIGGDMKEEEGWQRTLPLIADLTKRSIGQVWMHHTGHDESRGYGTKTREWRMDNPIDRV